MPKLPYIISCATPGDHTTTVGTAPTWRMSRPARGQCSPPPWRPSRHPASPGRKSRQARGRRGRIGRGRAPPPLPSCARRWHPRGGGRGSLSLHARAPSLAGPVHAADDRARDDSRRRGSRTLPLQAFIPCLRNAIFSDTGVRLSGQALNSGPYPGFPHNRSLPFIPELTPSGHGCRLNSPSQQPFPMVRSLVPKFPPQIDAP